jgi:hypothetical protein
MSGPYFHKHSWPTFVYQGQCYRLHHLDEYVLNTKDSKSVERRIAVSFTDHCFTRIWNPKDDPELIYPASSRGPGPGCFCFTRYCYSFTLQGVIQQALDGKAWNVTHNNFAIVSAVTHHNVNMLYSIIFSLEPVSGLPVDLHMQIQSAHLRDEKELTTYGWIRFRHLITLRMQNKRPPKNHDQRRNKPHISMPR